MSRTRPTRVSRRLFVQTSAALGLPAVASLGEAAPVFVATGANLEAFASATSVAPGGRLDFKARNPNLAGNATEPASLRVARLGWPDQLMLSTTVTLRNQVVPADASANGCASWPLSYRLNVPANWPSGLYWASFGGGSTACTVPFVVGAASRSTAKVLVQVPVTTAHAYNPYGGKSLYEYNSSAGVRGVKVSFNRPFSDPWNYAFDRWQPSFVRWLEKQGIVADYCTSLDLHQDSGLLNGYQLFTFAGHDEYWSRTMRDRLDAFVAAGGNAAIFSGNTCFWQVRFEDSGGSNRRMVCYKSRTDDPGGTAATKTTYWTELATPYPETSTIGLSFLKGASWTNALPRPVSPFVVTQPGHWAFEGIDLSAFDGFGAPYVGYETDAADFRTGADGRPYPTGLDGAPATLQILAQADCSGWDAAAQALGLSGERSGHAAIALFNRGGRAGTVFNAGTTDWAWGLQPELDGQVPTPVSRITLNVLRKLAAPRAEPAEVRQWHAAQPDQPWSCYDTIGTELPTGMVLDGAGYKAWPAAVSGAVAVYRYRGTAVGAAGTRYALSTSSNLANANWTRQGVAFYAHAANSAVVGALPVYQWRSADSTGLPLLRYSLSATPDSAWVQDGVAFRVPAG